MSAADQWTSASHTVGRLDLDLDLDLAVDMDLELDQRTSASHTVGRPGSKPCASSVLDQPGSSRSAASATYLPALSGCSHCDSSAAPTHFYIIFVDVFNKHSG